MLDDMAKPWSKKTYMAVARLFQQQQLLIKPIGNNSCFTMVMTNWFWAQ